MLDIPSRNAPGIKNNRSPFHGHTLLTNNRRTAVWLKEGKRIFLLTMDPEGCGKGGEQTWRHEHGGKVGGACNDPHKPSGHANVVAEACDGGDGLQTETGQTQSPIPACCSWFSSACAQSNIGLHVCCARVGDAACDEGSLGQCSPACSLPCTGPPLRSRSMC